MGLYKGKRVGVLWGFSYAHIPVKKMFHTRVEKESDAAACATMKSPKRVGPRGGISYGI